jgi:DNA modification methylase
VGYQVLVGDVLEKIKELPDNSVHCCVTSPPYFGLRDYGVTGQIGLEETPDEYVGKLVEVFRSVRRVLRDDGTLWLNLGDSYNAGRNGGHSGGGKQADLARHRGISRSGANVPGLKPKDLIGIPWRVAFALQSDGWYLRQDIIWNKPSPMPESVRDRCTKAHEYIFLLSKGPRYYFDKDAISEPAGTPGKFNGSLAEKSGANGDRNDGGRAGIPGDGKRNKRSVWTVTSKPFKGAHFATFPPELILPCILAGCPENGTVLDPFVGSGTTIQVALQNNRNAVGIELNPDYVKLIEKRLEKADVRKA